MKFTKVITLALALTVATPLLSQSTNVSAAKTDSSKTSSSSSSSSSNSSSNSSVTTHATGKELNNLAKKNSYVGVTYLYQWLQAQGIQYNPFYSEDNKIEYRNGKPEGVVIHETATPGASAFDEAIYFNREWMNMYAYVHAFIDANTVMQMMTPNYGAWGAGPMANDRFIHIELCEVDNIDDFVKSINNDAIYVAGLLKRYGLTPINATHDGEGTVWSHSAVSQFLGKTDHGDPDGYFASWGYSMDDFFDLISYYYNKKTPSKKPSTSKPSQDKDTSKKPDQNQDKGQVTPLPEVQPGKQTLMHDAYLYDSKGKRLKDQPLQKAGITVNVKTSKLINGRKFYQLSNKKYIVASNLDGLLRLVKQNAYIYNPVGVKVGKTKLLQGGSVKTYGSKVTIGGIKYYAIGPTQFVKANNLQ